MRPEGLGGVQVLDRQVDEDHGGGHRGLSSLGWWRSALRCFGASVLRCFGASVLRCFGASVLSRGRPRGPGKLIAHREVFSRFLPYLRNRRSGRCGSGPHACLAAAPAIGSGGGPVAVGTRLQRDCGGNQAFHAPRSAILLVTSGNDDRKDAGMSGIGGGAPWNPYGGGQPPEPGSPSVPPAGPWPPVPARPLTFGRLFNPIAVGRVVFTPSRPDRVHDPVGAEGAGPADGRRPGRRHVDAAVLRAGGGRRLPWWTTASTRSVPPSLCWR